MSSPFGPTGSGTPQEPAAEELVIGGKPKARRGIATAVVFIATGAVAGGILASTLGASASSSLTSATAADAAASSSAPAPTSAAPKKDRPSFAAPLSGKVTAVGTDTVTIQTTATGSTPSTTTTYSVTSTTRISINETGPGALTGVKVGDTVSFTVTAKGGTVLASLRDGNGPFGGGFGGRGPGGPGGFGGRGPGGPAFGGIVGVAPETGTVTAVGTDTVTIKTSTATTTYSVTSTSHILKPGTTKPTLSDVKVGDSVFFTVTAKGGTVIGNLIDGKLPTIAGHVGPGFGPGLGFGGGNGHGPQAPAASPSASTAATNT
jgi:hypothetical protein